MKVGLLVTAVSLGALLYVVLPMTCECTTLSAGEPEPDTGQVAEPTAPFSLTAVGGRLSLRAQNAPLKAIVEEMGRLFAVEVMASVPPEERVTLAFDDLTLQEALAHLRPHLNYAAVGDAAKGPGAVRRLVVVSKRLAGTPSRPTAGETAASTRPTAQAPTRLPPTNTPPDRPQPFRFEFDPSAGQEPR